MYHNINNTILYFYLCSVFFENPDRSLQVRRLGIRLCCNDSTDCNKISISTYLSIHISICMYIYIYIYIYIQLDIALWCKNQIEHSIWDESLLLCNCACSLEYSSLSTLAGLSYHFCGKLEVAFKASPSSQHQHCTDEAQKAETVLSAVRYSSLV